MAEHRMHQAEAIAAQADPVSEQLSAIEAEQLERALREVDHGSLTEMDSIYTTYTARSRIPMWAWHISF